MSEIPGILLKANLIKRINRFVAEVTLDDKKIHVYVPNTGRLSELALPGTEVLLSPINAKYKFKILYIINKSFPVMIDSTYSNRLFYDLLVEEKVSFLGQYTSIKREPSYANHRFDFHLTGNGEDSYIELKSCTLFHNKTGAFPDAISSRASDHVKALAESGKGKLVFLVLKNDIESFIPNYHTDYTFYETLKFYKDNIEIHAFAVQYDNNLKIKSLKKIPVIIPDIKPEGIYLLVLLNPEDTLNDNGKIFKKGYYIYCGSSGNNVFTAITSIKRKNVYLSILPEIQYSKLKIVSDLPVITQSITIKEVMQQLVEHNGITVSVYNQTDIHENQLIYFQTNPVEEPWFWDVILEFRFSEYSRK